LKIKIKILFYSEDGLNMVVVGLMVLFKKRGEEVERESEKSGKSVLFI